ncbi:MAG: mandelate racemase/muconate lactonizing enzyme family protein [Bryobacterales bacterium]|nr:mandelate racemase/muconate lactonizing enzyme family protein [Bryobacterales bacterium]
MTRAGSRRSLLRHLTGTAAAIPFLQACNRGPAVAAPNPRDVRIDEVRFDFEDHRYRFPHVFGGFTTDRATLLNVHCRVSDRQGRTAEGFGSMTMGNVWSWKTQRYSYEETLAVMKALASRAQSLMTDCKEFGHPIELNALLEPAWLRAASELGKERKLEEEIPKLCTLVTTSPFDAALHDAYGKLHGRSVWACYGKEFLNRDLSAYLGPEFAGQYPDRYVDPTPKAWMPIFHNVGLGDPVLPKERTKPLNDGLPELLGDWIRADGITHIKVKLRGGDEVWDLERILNVDKIASEAKKTDPKPQLNYSLDFNEQAGSSEYLLAFLQHLKERSPLAFERVQYIEQPTSRYMVRDAASDMHEAAKLRPVVIDEALTDVESLRMARELGYTGCALKACKGQSHTVVIASMARAGKMFLSVQDLTCPGASFIHSAAIAAHVPGVSAIEANGRQYVPSANEGWKDRFPGLFKVTNGQIHTAEISGPGLGAVA